MSALRLAFAGFRHGHILGLYKEACSRADVQVVAACEENVEAAGALVKDINITHHHYKQMLDRVPCDAVAIGDVYGDRGSIAIEALKRGKHIIADKPLLTELSEIDTVAQLAREKNLRVGCLLDMHCLPYFQTLHDVIQSGQLGKIQQIIFTGQHPLMYGSRPAWYFEKGKHGGTINDIAVHAMSMIPWLTGLDFSTVIAVRTWNALADKEPHFHDAAQMMLQLNNGCGVIGDVSYSSPGPQGYQLPQYWRFTIYGDKAMAETSCAQKNVTLAVTASNTTQTIAPAAANTIGTCLDWFLSDISGKNRPVFNTDWILKVSRQTLQVQHAADKNLRDAKLQP